MAYRRNRRRAPARFAVRSRRRSGLAAPRRSYSRRPGAVAGVRRVRASGIVRNVPFYIRQGGATVEAHAHTIGSAAPVALACNSTPGVFLLNGIAQGESVTEREGSRLTMKSLHLVGNFYSTIADTSLVGFALVYDKSPRGALPLFTDIFENSVNPVAAFQRLESRDRFQILFRKEVVLSGTYTAADERSSIPFDMKMALNRTSAFEVGNTTGTIADFTYGALYLVTFGDSAVAGRFMSTAARIVFAP